MSNMCALVLPQLLEKRKGAIANISSVSRQGFVGAINYSATKAYASIFSECLQRTYKTSGMFLNKLFSVSCYHANFLLSLSYSFLLIFLFLLSNGK